MRPRPTLKGTLETLTIRKKKAEVPRKPSFRKPAESRYIDITGPPALATIVVKPPSTPYERALTRPARVVTASGSSSAVGRAAAPHRDPGHQQQDRADRGPYDLVVGPHQEHRADDHAARRPPGRAATAWASGRAGGR